MKKSIRSQFRKVLRKSRTISHLLAELSLLTKRYPKLVDTAFKCYVEENLTKKQKKVLKRDIIFSDYYYGVDAEEYFRFDYIRLSDAARKEFIGVREAHRRLASIADKESREILTDKFKAYQHFRLYYNRDSFVVKGEESRTDFDLFIQKHSTFIVKPLKAYMGKGVFKLDLSNVTADEAFAQICEKGECVVEELIQQAPEMAVFHPASVNTVRVVSRNIDGKIDLLQTSVRLGSGGSVVDNGCFSAAVDTETGLIITRARAAHSKKRCIIHPDTGIQIIGNRIPKWEELMTLVHQLPTLLPKQKIIGWDMALSVNGWVVIEANACPHMQTLAGEGCGMRSVYDEIAPLNQA